MHQLIVIVTLAAAVLLGGCGQMGPLYEPGTEPPRHAPPTESDDLGITP